MGFFSSIRKFFSGSPATESAPPGTAPESHAGPGVLPADPADQPADSAERSPEDEGVILALRQTEPRLSAWLTVILQGVDGPGDLLSHRLDLLLSALDAPPAERRRFIDGFHSWLDDMGYTALDDFRSELQYRLALALDMEDEEDERSRLVLKLTEGLAKTRERIARNMNALFSAGRSVDESFWDDLEEVLIMADVGYETAHSLTERLRKKALAEGIADAGLLRGAMREELLASFKPARRITALTPPEVILMVGVNGVGKTTTIAKLCHRSVLQGKKVLLAAADTFRAAAVEQLAVWARRAGAEFYAKGHGADPAAVAYEAMDKAVTDGCDVVFIDTAGRLHTKANLMEELTKIRRVLGKRHAGAPHRTVLILDATTGQNGLSQVKLFQESAAVDEIILTKLDGTAKGGIVVAVAVQFGIPISFVGLGEKLEDLRPFDPPSFVDALLGAEAE